MTWKERITARIAELQAHRAELLARHAKELAAVDQDIAVLSALGPAMTPEFDQIVTTLFSRNLIPTK